MSGDRAQAERQGFVESIGQLRNENIIDAADQDALVRHYDQHKLNLEEELARITPEYERRVREDGEEQANQWLAETARELGERDGRSTRQMVDGLSVNRSIDD